MYSDLAVDSAVLVCFLLLQLTAAPPNVKTYTNVDLKSFVSPPFAIFQIRCVIKQTILLVPFKYLNIRFTAVQCVLVGFELNFATFTHCEGYIRTGTC